jgi:hypothetical protein
LAIKSLERSDQSETQLLYSLLQQVKFLRSRAWNVRSVRNAASIAIWATYLGSIFLQICLQLRFLISSTEFNAFIEQVTKKRQKAQTTSQPKTIQLIPLLLSQKGKKVWIFLFSCWILIDKSKNSYWFYSSAISTSSTANNNRLILKSGTNNSSYHLLQKLEANKQSSKQSILFDSRPLQSITEMHTFIA